MGRLQFWLQGHPNKWRPWPVIWLGNRISDLRYWWWRRTKSVEERVMLTEREETFAIPPYSATLNLDPRSPTATTNQETFRITPGQAKTLEAAAREESNQESIPKEGT